SPHQPGRVVTRPSRVHSAFPQVTSRSPAHVCPSSAEVRPGGSRSSGRRSDSPSDPRVTDGTDRSESAQPFWWGPETPSTTRFSCGRRGGASEPTVPIVLPRFSDQRLRVVHPVGGSQLGPQPG